MLFFSQEKIWLPKLHLGSTLKVQEEDLTEIFYMLIEKLDIQLVTLLSKIERLMSQNRRSYVKITNRPSIPEAECNSNSRFLLLMSWSYASCLAVLAAHLSSRDTGIQIFSNLWFYLISYMSFLKSLQKRKTA